MKKNIKSIDRNILNAASLGNVLEFYDFSLYAFLIPVLAPYFFPSSGTDTLSATISAIAALSVGFLARPFGAIIFGYIGDVYGRKRALLISILGMGIVTIIIGSLPSYNQVGIWAPILLTLCRFTQGMCAGGEYSGAGIFIVEHAKDKKGFMGSLLTSSGTIGAFIASIIAYICIQPWTPDWSWRVAFLLGGFIGMIGLYLRKNIPDTPEFKKQEVDKTNIPIVVVLKTYLAKFILCVCIGGLAVSPFYYVLAFLNPYLVAAKIISLEQMMIENTVYVLLSSIGVIVWGKFSDGIGLNRAMRMGAIMIVVSVTSLWLTSSSPCIILSKATLIIASSFFAAPSMAYMSSLFPAQYRCSGIALGYSLGIGVLGGSVPYISGLITKMQGNIVNTVFLILFIYVLYYIMDRRVIQHRKSPSK